MFGIICQYTLSQLVLFDGMKTELTKRSYGAFETLKNIILENIRKPEAVSAKAAKIH